MKNARGNKDHCELGCSGNLGPVLGSSYLELGRHFQKSPILGGPYPIHISKLLPQKK